MDEFRSIPGFSKYEVSSIGVVRRGEKIISQKTDKDGYRRVAITNDDGKRKTIGVHVAVCLAFIGPKPSPKHEVAHENRTRNDNRFQNLRWDTCKGNQADRKRHGTVAYGELNGRAKLTPSAVEEIRAALTIAPGKKRLPRGKVSEAAKKFGVDRNTISRAAMGQSWPTT